MSPKKVTKKSTWQAIDDGALWPVAFALMALTAAEEARISTLVKRAVR